MATSAFPVTSSSDNISGLLYVAQLPECVQEADLIDLFKPFGRIEYCHKNLPHFANVKFSTKHEACLAFDALQTRAPLGFTMQLEHANNEALRVNTDTETDSVTHKVSVSTTDETASPSKPSLQLCAKIVANLDGCTDHTKTILKQMQEELICHNTNRLRYQRRTKKYLASRESTSDTDLRKRIDELRLSALRSRTELMQWYKYRMESAASANDMCLRRRREEQTANGTQHCECNYNYEDIQEQLYSSLIQSKMSAYAKPDSSVSSNNSSGSGISEEVLGMGSLYVRDDDTDEQDQLVELEPPRKSFSLSNMLRASLIGFSSKMRDNK